MTGWRPTRIGDVLTLVRERVDLQPDVEYKRLTVRLGGLGVVLRDVVVGSAIRTDTQFRARVGQFVLSRIDARNGAFGIVPKELDRSVVSGNFLTFDCVQDSLLPKYLRYYVARPIFWDECSRISEGTTNRVPVRIEQFLEIMISLPALAEQRRIVARIEQLAVQIEEARRLRHQASEETEALLPSARSSCISELMEKHGSEPLGELISMASGEGLTSSEMDDSFEYPVYGGGGLNGRYSRYLFEESRIAIGRVGARCGCVFITEPKSWITDNAMYLTKFSDRLDHKFLVHALSNLDLRQQANQAAQPVVSQKKINPMEIPVPPVPEQRRIVEYLDGLAGQVAALARLQSETAFALDALLPSLLDKAFKGKL
jgi:type I restriction enzyme S subunit